MKAVRSLANDLADGNFNRASKCPAAGFGVLKQSYHASTAASLDARLTE